MIEARHLTKRYGDVKALDDVSFEVKKGEVLGFLGPNGAGKTTTMKILTCFIAPTQGTAKVNGVDIFEDSLAVRSAIGYLPESTPLYTEMMVTEYLDFVARMRGFRGEDARKRIAKVVDQTALGAVFGKEIRALSKGYRQRVGIAQALIHEPPLLILDEPLSGLDPNQAAEVRQLITHLGKERTVILSTHNLAEVQTTCSRVLIIANGKLVADDTPEELRDRAGKPRVIATFVAEGAELEKVRKVLAGIPGVAEVKRIDGGGTEAEYALTARGSDDLRPMVFRAAAKNELNLVGLEQRGENLEDVFRDLTMADAPETAKKTTSDEKKSSEPEKQKTSDAAPAKDTTSDTEDEKPADADKSDDESAA
ncbi:MAG: ATP-binding cassette domain-containing protein [Deltaproteobacteria bacterium]|nr:ATP-binding cassette domain-containing protein [Deltaproteobacteria bacterium]